MASIRMIVAQSPAQLLVRAAEGLFPLAPATDAGPWPTLPAWIVLRQGGLRDDFHSLAAQRGVTGWFDPTVCLLSELPKKWGTPGARPLSEADRTILLGGMIQVHGGGVFGAGSAFEFWVPELDSLIGDMLAEGISARELRSACEKIPGRDEFERRRDHAIVTLYLEWQAKLVSLDRSDDRAAIASLARIIRSDPAAFSERLGGRRDIRIVGIANLRGGYTALLRALRDCPTVDTVTIISSSHLAMPGDLEPVTTVDHAGSDVGSGLARTLFGAPGASDHLHRESRDRIQLIEAPDLTREVETIAVRVRALIDSGAKPSRIAIVFRNERPGIEAMASALTAMGVPVSARRRTSHYETAPARSLKTLLNAVAERWSRPALLDLVGNPLLRSELDVQVLNAAGRLQAISSLESWEPALVDLLAQCTDRDENREGRPKPRMILPRTKRVEASLAAWRAWLPEARSLSKRRTMSAWFNWVLAALEWPKYGIAEALAKPLTQDSGVWNADCRARDNLVTLAVEWGEAFRNFRPDGESIDADAFRIALAPLLATDVISQPDSDFGVVVSEAMAAGWRAFDHTFIAGVAAEEFPPRNRESAIFSDNERIALIAAGLPLDHPTGFMEREQELFRVLCASPLHSLTLSWPSTLPDGREVLRSRFVDHVVELLELGRESGMLTCVPSHHVAVAGFPLVTGALKIAASEHALQVAQSELTRSRALSPWNGQIEDAEMKADIGVKFGEEYVWSATQLETMAKCAWSWFAARLLRVTEPVDTSEELEASTSGTVLHAALDIVFAEARTLRKVDAVYLLPADAPWVLPIARLALDRAWELTSVKEWMGNPAYHRLVRAELSVVLKNYLMFEMNENEKSWNNRTKSAKQVRTGAHKGEWIFSSSMIEAANTRFLLRGAVDRIDLGVDTRLQDAGKYFAAVDYKTSKSSTPGMGDKAAWDDDIVLQLPLYAEVLRKEYPGLLLAHMEYRILRTQEVAHQLKFVSIKNDAKKGSTVEEDASANDKMDGALKAAARRVNMARAGELPANPAPSSGCSPYCTVRDVCRIPGGPVNTGSDE